MKPSLRAISLRVFLPIVAGLLSVCEVSWAQSQEKPAESTKNQTETGPRKPVHKPDWVVTDDSIARLAVPRTPRLAEAPAAGAANSATATAKEVSATPEDAAAKNAEIAALEKQIQDKQKRIALLMRLFVNDERPFLVNPGDVAANSAAQERRKYEQDELLYEAAEIARLRERVERLKTADSAEAAVKP